MTMVTTLARDRAPARCEVCDALRPLYAARIWWEHRGLGGRRVYLTAFAGVCGPCLSIIQDALSA